MRESKITHIIYTIHLTQQQKCQLKEDKNSSYKAQLKKFSIKIIGIRKDIFDNMGVVKTNSQNAIKW